MTDQHELDPDAKVRRAKARDSLTEDWIDGHDKTNDAGEKIEEVPYRGTDGNSFDVNLSNLFGPAPSTTGDVNMLVLEAEMLADGRDLGNPHVPINEEVAAEAADRIEDNGHSPAWPA